jgi:hypothetical protein
MYADIHSRFRHGLGNAVLWGDDEYDEPVHAVGWLWGNGRLAHFH